MKKKVWNGRVKRMELPEEFPLKTFKPKCKNLEVLEEHGEKLEEDYWGKWERRGRMGAVSWVDAVKLKKEAK